MAYKESRSDISNTEVDTTELETRLTAIETFLQNNNTSLPGSVQFSSATAQMVKTDTSSTISIVRNGGSDGELVVTVAATSTTSAVYGTEYTTSLGAATGTVTFGPGDSTPKQIVIYPSSGNISANENVTLTITQTTLNGGSDDAALRDTQTTHALTIIDTSTAATSQTLGISTAGAGNFSFWRDYSELSGTGTHTFYVQRTHGTTGECSVTLTTYDCIGTAHTPVTDVLTWTSGEAGIKSVDVAVSTKSNNGLHVIYAVLSNPTNGAQLLHGATHTKAYGVIDDSTVPDEADAWFFDADAVSDGNGTKASPYNDWASVYAAADGVTTKRYICCTGTWTPSGQTADVNGGGGTTKVMYIPSGRTNEQNRLFIMSWPGQTQFNVDGTGLTDVGGFWSNHNTFGIGDASYTTFRDISFTNLDSYGSQVNLYTEGFGIYYTKGAVSGINVELCSFDNINGASNTAGVMAENVTGQKLWRCTANNIQSRYSTSNGNAGGLYLSYSCEHTSIQRCESSNSNSAMYPKRTDGAKNMPQVSFCYFHDCKYGLYQGFGTSTQGVNNFVFTHNLVKDCNTGTGIFLQGAYADGVDGSWIAHNVFHNCGVGDNGALYSKDSYDLKVFHNIFFECRKGVDIPEAVQWQSNGAKTQVAYLDYNHVNAATLLAYEYLGTTYNNSAALAAATSFAANDSSNPTSSNPLFTNTATNDYTLQGGSPCKTVGLNDTDLGIYLTGNEVVGASLS